MKRRNNLDWAYLSINVKVIRIVKLYFAIWPNMNSIHWNNTKIIFTDPKNPKMWYQEQKKKLFSQILCEKMHIMIFAEVHHSKTNWKIFLMWPSLLVLQKLKINNKKTYLIWVWKYRCYGWYDLKANFVTEDAFVEITPILYSLAPNT